MSEPSEDLKRTVSGAGKAVDRAEQTTERVLRLLRLVVYGAGVLVFACAALLYLTQELGREVDGVSDDTMKTSEQVDHLEEFVEELEQENPEGVVQNAAIAEAVRIVPELREILCEAFPEATACRPR